MKISTTRNNSVDLSISVCVHKHNYKVQNMELTKDNGFNTYGVILIPFLNKSL